MDIITFGSAVKALGAGKIGGHLVLYGDETTPDLSAHKDYFTKSTEYDIEPGDRRSMYWAHGQDPKIGVKKIGTLTVTPDDHGLWVEGVLYMADEYQRSIYDLAEKGKLGWSSGAPSHLVTRKAVETKSGGTVHEILTWPIAEGSLTPTPADYRNQSYTIKSLRDSLTDEVTALSATEDDDDPTDGDEAADTPMVPISGKQVRADITALKALLRGSMTFSDHADIAQDAMEGFVNRAMGLAETSTKAGRQISAANRDKMKKIHAGMQVAHDAMAEHMGRMGQMLTETDPDAKKSADEVAMLRMQFLRRQSRALGVPV